MNPKNGVPAFAGAMSRRDFSRLLGQAGLGLVSLNLVTGRAHAADNDLMVIDWPAYHVPEILGAYVEKHGALPPNTPMSSNEDALQKILSGAYPADTAHPDTYDIPRWRKAGVLRPIDETRLPNWANVFDAIKNVNHVYGDGKLWIIPAVFGTTTVLYRTDLVDPEDLADPSWSLLWNEKYKGKVAMRGTGPTGMLVAGLMNGVTDVYNMTEDQISAAAETLRKQRDLNRFYWNEITSMEQAMASGEIVASVGWASSAVAMKANGVPVAMLHPKEGEFTWLDGIVWANTGKGPEDKVYDLMNAWLEPAAGKYIIETQGYGHTNAKAYDLVAPGRLEELGLNDPIGVLGRGHFGTLQEDARAKMARLLEDIVAGF